jgi:hypothetical protein
MATGKNFTVITQEELAPKTIADPPDSQVEVYLLKPEFVKLGKLSVALTVEVFETVIAINCEVLMV